MQQTKHIVLGQMSGTSLDGQDLVLVELECVEGCWNFTLLAAHTFAYDPAFVDQLKQAHQLSVSDLESLNLEYGLLTQQHVSIFLEKHSEIHPELLCFHGHTVKHLPQQGITHQLGSWQQWANYFELEVVGEFRKPDVALGGQGAPLVPGGDIHLFSKYDYTLNLGGFANITDITHKQPMAYDICAVNTVLNRCVEPLGMLFDKGGQLAASGELITDLYDRLNTLEYYQKKAPKSLGIEWVEEVLIPVIDEFSGEKIENILHTYIRHIAYQIARCLPPNKHVLISGGGAYNHFLMEQIRAQTQANIELGSLELTEFKEALIFAFLGVLRKQKQVNCWASVTGADKNHSTGIVFFPEG